MTHNGAAGRARWLIVTLTDGETDVLTLDGGGDRVLPVFSFRDEAEMYVHLHLGTPGWEPKVFSADEIVSMLLGSLSDVTRVALDPLPEACDKTLLDLLCVRRDAFVRSLLGEEGDLAAPAETSLRRPRPTLASAGPPATRVDAQRLGRETPGAAGCCDPSL